MGIAEIKKRLLSKDNQQTLPASAKKFVTKKPKTKISKVRKPKSLKKRNKDNIANPTAPRRAACDIYKIGKRQKKKKKLIEIQPKKKKKSEENKSKVPAPK